ncbi:MAG: sulfite exporter TauE/SafE family protein [Leptospirillia bacterium]
MAVATVYFILYLATGAAAGLLAGLLGVGGGLVVVPALTFAFAAQGYSDTTAIHAAVGTSLAAIVPTAMVSMRAHHRARMVDWKRFRSLAPALAIGALAGAALARWMDGSLLRASVGLFALFVALHMGFGGQRKTGGWNPPPAAAGTGIGALSALVGIGGGSLTVPYLLRCGLPIHPAVGTSAAGGLPIALAGSLAFSIGGGPGIATGIGHIHLPALVSVSAASMLCAPLGARWAHRTPAAALRRWFAVLLGLIGTVMLAG